MLIEDGGQIRHGLDLLSIHLGDEVVSLQAGLLSRAALSDLTDADARGGIAVQRLVRARLIGDGHAQRRTDDLAVLDQIGVDALHGLHRDGEAETLEGSGGIDAAGVLQGVDADQLALIVEQAAAGVAGVDGCVVLDVADLAAGVVGADAGALQSGDDALRHGVGQNLAAGIADGDHSGTDLQLFRGAEGDGNQLGSRVRVVHLQHGQIGGAVGADQRRVHLVARGHQHLIGGAVGDDVVIGQHVAALGHDHAGALRNGLIRHAVDVIPGLGVGQNTDHGIGVLLGDVDGRALLDGLRDGFRVGGSALMEQAEHRSAQRHDAYQRQGQQRERNAIVLLHSRNLL